MNPLNKKKTRADRHWSKIGDFECGDIKLSWELSRFAFVYALVRSYWRTGDEKYAEIFWRLVEDWRDKNPPNCGVNWKCGQESAFRVMAWCFGMYGFMNAAATRPDRFAALAQMIAVSGERIEGNIDYALSQDNNHGISEAAGLWTIGALFPELKPALHWRRLGGGILEELAGKLIYDDGCFAQLSSNYHRLVLQLYTWVVGLDRLNSQSFGSDLLNRLRKALNWSYQLMEKQNGRMPNSGGNDSSLLLPLTNCDLNDHRPALQALSYLLNRELLFPEGPWDEEALWLFGPDALQVPRRDKAQNDFVGGEGGFHVLRNPKSWSVLRCGPYKHRPAHADLLHLDVWWRGQNIALDPGSYSYNKEGPWRQGLAGTGYHNTVSVDQQDQMDKVGRFLWLPWARSSFLGAKRSSEGNLAWMEGVHQGYRRSHGGPIHKRTVLSLRGEWWLIIDSLIGGESHGCRLHWLFKHAPHDWDEAGKVLSLDCSVGKYQVVTGSAGSPVAADLLIADPESQSGWWSPYYQSKEPAISLALETLGRQGSFWTAMGPAGFKISMEKDTFLLESKDFLAHIELEANIKGASSGLLMLKGKYSDRLELP